MKIALSTDHAGFEKLKALSEFLVSKGYECHNFGPARLEPEDDYPDFIKPAAEAIAKGECDMGIIMGGSGQGEAMAANRHKGVRCAVYYGTARASGAVDAEGHHDSDPYEIIKLSRQHNNANMLSIAARFVNEQEIQKVALLWFQEGFSNVEHHARRIQKLDQTG